MCIYYFLKLNLPRASRPHWSSSVRTVTRGVGFDFQAYQLRVIESTHVVDRHQLQECF